MRISVYDAILCSGWLHIWIFLCWIWFFFLWVAWVIYLVKYEKRYSCNCRHSLYNSNTKHTTHEFSNINVSLLIFVDNIPSYSVYFQMYVNTNTTQSKLFIHICMFIIYRYMNIELLECLFILISNQSVSKSVWTNLPDSEYERYITWCILVHTVCQRFKCDIQFILFSLYTIMRDIESERSSASCWLFWLNFAILLVGLFGFIVYYWRVESLCPCRVSLNVLIGLDSWRTYIHYW